MKWNNTTCAGLFLISVVLSGCLTIKHPDNVVAVKRTLLTTGYCKCQECTGWHRTWYGVPVYSQGPNKGKRKAVGITASGTRARTGTIAADTSRYPFGTIMYIPEYGYGRVEDRGSAVKGNHIDLFFRTHKRAVRWGRQRKTVTIWIPAGK